MADHTSYRLDESASLYGVTGPILRPGGMLLTERGISRCRLDKASRLIDVGCGSGATIAFLREKYKFAAVGIDVSSTLIGEQTGHGHSIPFIKGLAEELPFRSEAIDGVLCECVLSLLAEPACAIREFTRVLRPGGYLMISDLYDRCVEAGPSLEDRPGADFLRGVRARREIEHDISSSGLELLLWEDHTAHLKVLAAQLVLSNGSMQGFRDMFGSGCGGRANQSTVAKVGPGYYLLIAQKI